MGIWKYSEDYKEYRRNEDGNGDVFRCQLRQVEHMAISIIEWPGLPDLKMGRDIEYITYTNRMSCIADFKGVPTVCKAAASRANMYGEPVEVQINFPDGSVANRPVWMGPESPGDAVVIINDTQVPGFGRIDTVAMWADRYTDAQTTIDTQIVNQRTPLIISGADRNQLDKSRRIVVELVNGVKCMAVDDGVVNQIKALDLKAPWNVPDLVQLQATYTKRMLAGSGIDSTSWRKAERLVVDEQEADDESLALTLQDMLNARLIAAQHMKEKYGWNVEPRVITPVRIKSETDTDDGEAGPQEGGEDAAA